MASTAGVLALLHFGRPVLVPMAMAILISLILYPLVTRLEQYKFSRISAAITVIGLITLVVIGVFYLFGTQIMRVTQEFSSFESKLTELTDQVIRFINTHLAIVPNINGEELVHDSQRWMGDSGKLVTTTVERTATILTHGLMVLVYTFLILIYRSGMKKVVLESTPVEHRIKVHNMLEDMQKVGQNYLVGVTIMIGILGVANSTVLLLFNIDHPFFFGFTAAILTIIPYVGTTLGASLPVIYAFMTHDNYWVPLGVMFCFWLIQVIESNILNPRIVGGNLNINALFALLSLFLGGYLWGVAGMILFLPFVALFKVFCSYFETLRPISLLLSNDLYDQRMQSSWLSFKRKKA